MIMHMAYAIINAVFAKRDDSVLKNPRKHAF